MICWRFAGDLLEICLGAIYDLETRGQTANQRQASGDLLEICFVMIWRPQRANQISIWRMAGDLLEICWRFAWGRFTMVPRGQRANQRQASGDLLEICFVMIWRPRRANQISICRLAGDLLEICWRFAWRRAKEPIRDKNLEICWRFAGDLLGVDSRWCPGANEPIRDKHLEICWRFALS